MNLNEKVTTPRSLSVAKQILPILKQHAKVTNQQAFLTSRTLTYGDLVNRTNIPGLKPVHMGKILDVVSIACSSNGHPDLAAMVVNSTSREPGSRYHKKNDEWRAEMQKIASYDWDKVNNLEIQIKVRLT